MGIFEGKQGFSTYLSPGLIRRLNIAATILNTPIYALAEEALTAVLEQRLTPDQLRAIDASIDAPAPHAD